MTNITIKKVENNFQVFMNNEPTQLITPNKQDLINCVENEKALLNAIHEQLADQENNYGVLFYLCGFDGKKQDEEMQRIEDEYDIYIF